MSKSFAFGVSACLLVFIAALAASTYGLGKEEYNKESAAYNAANIFTTVTASGTIIGLILLVIAILRMCSASGAVASSMNFPV